MSEFTIREARKADSQRIFDLIFELALYEKLDHVFVNTRMELEKWLFETPIAGCFVAEQDGLIVGYAIYFRSFSTFLGRPGFWLEDLYVTPELRGKGIGKALLRRLAVETVMHEPARLEWAVLDWNQPAIDFYEAIGAQIMPDWRMCRLAGDRLRAFAGE